MYQTEKTRLIIHGAPTFTPSIFTLLSMCACFCFLVSMSHCQGSLITMFESVVWWWCHSLNLVFYQVLRSLTHPVCGIIGLHLTKDDLSVWYTFISLLWLSLCQPIMTVSCSPLGHYQGHLKCISFKQSSTGYSHLSFGSENYSLIVTNRSIQSLAVISDFPQWLCQHSGLSSY